jgi:ABC-type transporter Mla MlaB component
LEAVFLRASSRFRRADFSALAEMSSCRRLQVPIEVNDLPNGVQPANGGDESCLNMLRIERSSDGNVTTLHLIGRLQEEHIPALICEIEKSGSVIQLSMTEVGLVDIAGIRFLARCRSQGIRLLGSSQYIMEWIDKELS